MAKISRHSADLTSVLLAWPFVLSLAILLANDLYLKAAYPGWLSGKLSDFAGMFLVAYLGFGLARKGRLQVAIALALCFVYWKSPASQPLIDFINSVIRFRIGRVVDYTDLVALISIPLAWIVISGQKRIGHRYPYRRLLAIPVATLTVLAVSGTSVLLPSGEYSIRNTDKQVTVSESEIVKAIERVTARYELQCENCEEPTGKTVYSNEDMYFSYSFDEASNGIFFELRVHRMKGLLVWRRPDYDLFESFMRSLKSEMGKLSPSMEFVQSLSGPRYNY